MLRKEQGLTQPELAKILGRTKGAIGHWEVGNREPGLGTIHDLAKMFNVSIDFMIGVSDFRNEEDTVVYMFDRMQSIGLVDKGNIDKNSIDAFISKMSMVNEFFSEMHKVNVAI